MVVSCCVVWFVISVFRIKLQLVFLSLTAAKMGWVGGGQCKCCVCVPLSSPARTSECQPGRESERVRQKCSVV